MKRTKQILALLLAVLMIVPTLAACSHTDDEQREEIKITLTPDVAYVTQATKDVKVSFAVDGGELADEISADDIYLGSSFKKMSAELISHSKNNLTLQLKGDIVPNEANAYQWGTVNVYASAFKKAEQDVTANIDIKVINGLLDATTLKFDGGKATVNYITYASKADELNKDNIKIDGVTVESVEKVNDETVKLTLAADGVKSANEFADFVCDKMINANGVSSYISLSQASFYPVFDYAEDNGSNIKMTLMLYIINGSAKELKAEAVSFDDDFDGAKVDSLEVDKDDDSLATVIISVPNGGQSAEELKMNGTITIAAGGLANLWGDKTTVEASYTRDYSSESMGRGVTLNTDTLKEIQKYTSGRDSFFGEVCYWAGNAGTAVSIAKTILEMTGVLKSEHQEVMEQLSLINSKLDTVISNQNKIMIELDKLAETINEIATDSYKKDLNALKASTKQMEDLLKLGAMYLALQDAVADGRLDKMPRSSDFDKYEDYLPKTETMSYEELEAYNNRVVDYCLDRSKDEHDPEFDDFKTTYDTMKDCLGNVADRIGSSDRLNPITRYDTICSYRYNFDTQCYEFRLAERVTAAALMLRALSVVAVREKLMTYPKEVTYANLQTRVQTAMEWIDESYDLIGHPADEINHRPLEKKNYDSDYFVFCYVTGTKLFYAGGGSPWANSNDVYLKNKSLPPFYTFPQQDLEKFQARSVEHKDNIYEELKSAGLSTSARIVTKNSGDGRVWQKWGTLDSNYSHKNNYTQDNIDNYGYIYLTPYVEDTRIPKESDNGPVISYKAYVEDRGWMPLVYSEGDKATTAGTMGQSKRLEALCIVLADDDNNPMITYRAYSETFGWRAWQDSGTSAFSHLSRYVGTVGQAKRMEAIEIKLKDEYAEKYDVVYRVYMANKGWGDWVKNGQTAGTTGESRRIEAIQIKLVEK